MTDISRFLGFNFARGTKSEIMAQVVSRCDQPFSFIITPNVDFVTRAAESAEAKKLYSQATLQICDSRILALLASSLSAKNPPVCPFLPPSAPIRLYQSSPYFCLRVLAVRCPPAGVPLITLMIAYCAVCDKKTTSR